MLILNLKGKFYNMIERGEKKIEYRGYKKYWHNRIKNVLNGDKIKIVYGYTKRFMYAKLLYIDVLPVDMIPLYAQELFKNDKYVYAIHFDLF